MPHNPNCTECDPKDNYSCPYCGHNCDMSAKTIHTDEDGHCHKCGKDCLMSSDGLSMVVMENSSSNKEYTSS